MEGISHKVEQLSKKLKLEARDEVIDSHDKNLKGFKTLFEQAGSAHLSGSSTSVA